MADAARRVTRVEYVEATPGSVLQPVSNGALLLLDRRAFLYGGWCNGKSLSQSIEYDLAARQWCVGPPLPAPRSESTVSSIGGIAVIFGGWDDKTTVAQTLVANLVDGKPGPWECLTSAKQDDPVVEPPARRMHSMCTFTDRDSKQSVFVFGGFSGEQRFNDLWNFDVHARKWTPVAASGFIPSPRDSSCLAADPDNGRLLLFGGYSSCRLNDFYVFDIANATWIRQPTLTPPSARFGCFGVLCNGQLIVGLGQDARGASSQLFQLKLASNEYKWTVVPIEGDEIEPRIHFSWGASENGKRVIVFGGSTDKKHSTTTFEIELDKVEPVAGGPAKKK